MQHNYQLNNLVRWFSIIGCGLILLVTIGFSIFTDKPAAPLVTAFTMYFVGFIIGNISGSAIVTIAERHFRTSKKPNKPYFQIELWLQQLAIQSATNPNLQKTLWLSEDNLILLDPVRIKATDLRPYGIENITIECLWAELITERYWVYTRSNEHYHKLPDGSFLVVWKLNPENMPATMSATIISNLKQAA